MKSHERRIEKLEDKTMNTRPDAPDNLGDLYATEDDPKSEMSKALDALYNPNRGTKNPNDAI
ncbi:hypothetical protein [Fodinibius salsisoli]|uniref:Uncharacterized protein n=1 Tax=Fodinibius salsisoli TaxID=2820877 RepID=A0ABT3PQE9_9BACT|nr:hypothetical protein [Fodinibius salsisoli]MCW9708093.1 hypothetical protein [Fodinibius salsisoli]